VDALAILRPDDWNLALFLHVLGAMVMVGALVLALGYLASAWRAGSVDGLRYGYRILLAVGIPAFLVMRLAGQWVYAKEHLDDLPSAPAWLDIGFSISDIGLLFLIVATAVAGVGARRASPAGSDGPGPGTAGTRVAAVLTALLLVAYVVAIWAMTTKPG
jgi:hypothetical protein